ncbi:hypothetical protein ACUTAF_24455 [Pseudomonas sp. SP16.1]|uniref:hypothetical protein n=1 Tax=Pseudomonas sp. SP16.1 TaxID=3458854 RepID=UPI00404581F8
MENRLSSMVVMGLMFTVFAGVVAAMLGVAAVMGQAEAVLRFQGVSELLNRHWVDVMILGPGMCVVFGAAGGMMIGLGASARRRPREFAYALPASEKAGA